MKCRILENANEKHIISESMNCSFNKRTGYTETWGRTRDEDPDYNPFGPTLADIELSTICETGCKH